MSYSILIVDDHTLFRRGIRALIHAHYPDWEIGEAENGVKAILACAAFRQDIVLMDYDMPKLDGITAARQILKDHPATRILMISMHDGFELAERLLNCGVMGYIPKTAAEDEFLHALSRIRQGLKYFPTLNMNILPSPEKISWVETQRRTGLHALTSREAEIFRKLVSGIQPSLIAEQLGISIKTLDTHKMSIFRKCGVHSLPELIRFAYLHNAV